jgi:signal recognition particle GTPase
MPQKKFAALIYRETGYKVSTLDLARMESYKKTKATSPEKPFREISEFIYQHLDQDRTPPGTEAGEKGSSDLSQDGDNDEESEIMAGRNLEMGETNRELIQDIVSQYQDLGLGEVEGGTAQEMIASIKANIRKAEEELLGDSHSIPNSTSHEAVLLRKQLEELEDEEAEIDEELKVLIEELVGVNGAGFDASAKI